jgi:hypothetical protein
MIASTSDHSNETLKRFVFCKPEPKSRKWLYTRLAVIEVTAVGAARTIIGRIRPFVAARGIAYSFQTHTSLPTLPVFDARVSLEPVRPRHSDHVRHAPNMIDHGTN